MSKASMTGLEKAAVLLKSLSPEVVDKVMAHMEPKQAKVLAAELGKAAARPDLKEAAAKVLDEAIGVLSDGKPHSGNTNPATQAKQTHQVDVRIEGGAIEQSDNEPIAALASIAPEVLAKALETESSRTIALLMDRMDVEAAGRVYKRFSAAKRNEISLRFTDSMPVSDDLLKHVADAVRKKCDAMTSEKTPANDQGDREKRMAGLLRSLERNERLETLTALEEANAELAGRIKAMLYLFEDILRMENSSIQKLLSEIDMKALASALFGAQTEIQDRIMGNLSRRAQESLKEEVELTGKVPAAKVKQSRQSLEEAMQRLDQRGELIMLE